MQLRSPWIEEMNALRSVRALSHDIETDVVIVGAGIAGIATAYKILEQTNKKVILVERGLLAHGATGNNAGMLFAGFERPFTELAADASITLATEAIQEVESGWDLLESILIQCGSSLTTSRHIGYGGLTTHEEVIGELGKALHLQEML